MMRNRILALLLCVLLAVLSGCDTANTGGSEQSSQSGPSTAISGGKYRAEDSDAQWSESSAVVIDLADGASTSSGAQAAVNGDVVTIGAAGTYVLRGSLSNGQVVVDSSGVGAVRIVLDGVDITCTDSSPIYVRQADKAVVILADGSENKLTDTANYSLAAGEDEPNATLFSKDDLSITGGGALVISANYRDGIASKDDLVITDGNITVTAVEEGVRGRDSVSISGGELKITAGNDGIKANNSTDADKGWICLDGGVFSITAGHDAVQAETTLTVLGGEYTVVAGGGSANAPAHTSGFGGWRERPQSGGGQTPPDMQPEPNAGDGNVSAVPTSVTTDAGASSETESDSYKGFKAGGALVIGAGSFDIDSQDDAIHSNGDVTIESGNIVISTGDDGVHADGALTINGGEIQIKTSYEGLEGNSIDINSGEIRLTASDDGLNAAGGSDGADPSGRTDRFLSAGSSHIRISGGYVLVNASGDGIDANGNLYFDGGTVVVYGPSDSGNGALDFDGECLATGGELIAVGSSGMALAPSTNSEINTLWFYFTETQSAGTMVTLTDSSGGVIATLAPQKQFQNIVFTSPKLTLGESYTISTGGTVANGGVYAADGYYGTNAAAGSAKLCDVTLSSSVTRISSDGGEVAGGMGGMGGGRQRPSGAAMPQDGAKPQRPENMGEQTAPPTDQPAE